MSQEVVANCEWFDRQYGSGKWEPYDTPNEIVQCRASLGEKIVTVWLPKGAKIRLRLPRIDGQSKAFTHEFRHTFGRDRDKQIRIKLTKVPEGDQGQ